jgi:PIN domain nuclease of toxin-antitoxin system
MADSRRLSKKARATIEESGIVYVSAVSAWEIETKRARGLLEAPDDLEVVVRARDLKSLSLTMAHAVAAAHLPPYHRDPFDRMLVAQAQAESLTLMTHDSYLPQYGIATLIV